MNETGYVAQIRGDDGKWHPINMLQGQPGPQGPEGKNGADGKSPYQLAAEGGYTGTESTFNSALTAFPYHHTRHEEGGADPITVTAGMIDASSRTQYFTVNLSKTWSGSAAPFTQTVTVNGMLANDKPKVYFTAPTSAASVEDWMEAFSLLYKISASNGSVTFSAYEKPSVAITVTLEVTRI